MYEIFMKIFGMSNFNKNNTAMGQGELALALFFADCVLPDGQGDIELTNKDKIEVKTNNAVISDRINYKALDKARWKDLRGTQCRFSDDEIFEKLNLSELKPRMKDEAFKDALKKKMSVIDTDKEFRKCSSEEKRFIKFKVMFCGLFNAYSKEFEKMIILNTDDSAYAQKHPLSESKTLTTPVAVIMSPKLFEETSMIEANKPKKLGIG